MAPEHDPKVYLDRAADNLAAAENDALGGILDPEAVMVPIQAAQAYAAMAQAAALLQPTPEEVIEAYRQATAEVVQVDAEKLEKLHRVLAEAKRSGPRHPAIYRALEILEG